MVRTTVTLPDEVFAWLKNKAEAEDRSISSLVRRAVEEFCSRERVNQ